MTLILFTLPSAKPLLYEYIIPFFTAVLAVMSFVINEKRLKACNVQNKKELILKWLDERNVKQEDFESYYQYYPKWISSMIAELYREEL